MVVLCVATVVLLCLVDICSKKKNSLSSQKSCLVNDDTLKTANQF